MSAAVAGRQWAARRDCWPRRPNRRKVITKEQSDVRGWRYSSWGILALLALVLLLFRDVVFRHRIFFDRDIHAYWWGQVEVFVRCVAAGSWPLWDPYVGFGQPFLANPSAQVLYPWTWLNLLMSAPSSYTVYVVMHTALSGLGLLAVGRRLGMSRSGAFLAAASWLLSGPFLSFVNLWHHLAGAAWIPWVLLAADRLIETPTPRRGLVLGMVMGVQLLAGSAEMCLLTALLTIAWAVPACVGRNRWRNRRFWTACAVAFTFAIALSAGQWLPALEYASRSDRAGLTSAMRTYWSLHPVSLAQIVIPVLPQELPLDPSVRTTLFDAIEPFLTSVYLGLTTLPLVVAALLASPRRPARFFAIALLVALAVALGRHNVGYSLATWLVPPLRAMRYPSKAMILVALAWALLVGFGFDAWRRGLSRRHLGLLVGAGAVLTGLAWGGVLVAGPGVETWAAKVLMRDPPGATYAEIVAPARHAIVVASALSTMALVLVLATLRRAGRMPGAALAALLGFVSVTDLFYANGSLNPTAPQETFEGRSPVREAISGADPVRIFVFDYIDIAGKTYQRPRRGALIAWSRDPLMRAAASELYPMAAVAKRWGAYGSYDLDPLALFPRYLQNLSFILRASEETPGFLRLLRMGAVQHVVALHEEGLEDLVPEAVFPGPFPRPVRLFQVPATLPRTYVVGQSRVAPGRRAIETLAEPGFDPAREVLLEETALPDAAGPFSGQSTLLELRPDRVRISAQLDRPGYVVLVDSYDAGWRATLDGKEAPILRANVGFRAVAAPAGSHVVEFVYRPRIVMAGLAVSAVAALLAAGAAVAGRRRRA